MRERTGLLVGLWMSVTATAGAQVSETTPAVTAPASQAVAVTPNTSLPSAGSTTVDPVRVRQLRESFQLRDPVPGVARGWEGDPRTESWVSRCDDHSDRNACWLVGIQLAPAIDNAANTHLSHHRYYTASSASPDKPSGRQVALQYLQRACDLASGEACADIGDFHRFQNKRSMDEPGHFDLKRAYGYYKRACELTSAHGCYVLAEMTDRGIGAQRDTTLARALFGELCQSGVAIACLRQGAPEAAHPYKAFSPYDSSCASSSDCLNACQQGIWGACQKVNWATTPVDRKEVLALSQKACREGSDWGCSTAYAHEARMVGCEGRACKKPSAARPLQVALVEGCESGSEWSCRQACSTFKQQVATQFACDARFPFGRYFAARTVQLEMQDCFGGDYRACDYFLGSSKVQMTPEEATAYRGSAYFFQRMTCNAAPGLWSPTAGVQGACILLVQHHGDSQLGRAYEIARHIGRAPTEPFFQAFSPMERAMASGWMMYNSVGELALPQDVIIALDGVCTRYPNPHARSCRVLGDFFQRKSMTVASNPERAAALNQARAELNKLDAAPALLCLPAGTSTTGGTVTAKMVDDCRRANQKREEDRAYLLRSMDFWQSQPSSSYAVNPQLKAMADDYFAKACKAGDAPACAIQVSR